MLKYEKPCLEITLFMQEEVITTSNRGGLGKENVGFGEGEDF